MLTKVNIHDVATIERAKEGKIYPKNATLIALGGATDSESGGILRNLKDGKVSRRYAVIQTKGEIEDYYLHHAILNIYDEFYATMRTTINFQMDAFKFMDIWVETDENKRKSYINVLKNTDGQIEQTDKLIELGGFYKKWMLENMFVSVDDED